MTKKPILNEVFIREKFVCQKTGACCRQPGFVYVKEEEADAMAAFLSLDVRDFVNQFCDLQDRSRLVLKKNGDESCVFLSHSLCQIHSVRPAQCRDFPFTWRTEASLKYCEGLKRLQ